MLRCFDFQTVETPLHLVIGTISSPYNIVSRKWKRDYMMTNMRFSKIIFVIGIVSQDRCKKLYDLEYNNKDMISVMAKEGNIRGSIDKTIAWFTVAPSIFTKTKFFGKTDDDTFVHLPNLQMSLSFLPRKKHLIAGWIQHSYMGTTNLTMCGHLKTSNDTCKDRYVFGPYYYPASSLELISKRVCDSFSSRGIVNLINKYNHRFRSANEDSIIGFIIANARLRQLHFVDLHPNVGNLWHMDNKIIYPRTMISVHKFNSDIDALENKMKKESRQNIIFKTHHIPLQYHIYSQYKLNKKWESTLRQIDYDYKFKTSRAKCTVSTFHKDIKLCRFPYIV